LPVDRKLESVQEPEVRELEVRIAEAERKAIELRPTAPAREDFPGLQASRERASAIVSDALALTDAHNTELNRLGREHDAELRRFADEAKQLAIQRSTEASKLLDELAIAERDALGVLPDDWRNPWVPSWPPVYFIRSTPGGRLTDTHIEDAKSWAKWQCTTTALSSGSEKLSFFHLWQNSEDDLILADISVRLNLTGHFECSAEGNGVPAGWFWENRSDADVSARLTVWPVWIAHDPSQQPQYVLPVADLIVTAGVFSQSTGTSINQSLLVKTERFAVPAEAFILIEASVVLDYAGVADVDFASGDFRVGCPYCFVTVPVPQMALNP
jgi:hypothetical protein